MSSGAARLPRRNVEVFDSNGTVIAGMSLSLLQSTVQHVPHSINKGFWQYGTVHWDDFYKYLIPFFVVSTNWLIFQYEPNQQQCGAPCPLGTEIVKPGNYVLLSTSE
jgi:hypothetical protein